MDYLVNMSQKGLKSPATALALGSQVTSWTKRNWKPIAWSVGGITLGIVIYQIAKKASQPDLRVDRGREPSNISRNQAIIKAEQLHAAMRGIGTDEEAIYNALRGVNYNGFVMISDAFGLKPYVDNDILGGGEPGIDFFGTKRPLLDWLTRELSDSELNELRELIPGVL